MTSGILAVVLPGTLVSFNPGFLKKWSFVHFILSSTRFQAQGWLQLCFDLGYGSEILTNFLEKIDDWVDRSDRVCLLFFFPSFSVKPLIIDHWEGVCPSFSLPLLADLSSASVWYLFFYPGLSEKKGGTIFWSSGVPYQSEALWRGDALSQGFCLHWDWRCEIWICSLKCLESLCLDEACCPWHMLSCCGLKPRILSTC